jgi:hypothetical protein
MLPLSDGVPARRFPVVNVLPIVANFAVFILYELPHLNTAVYHASFYPCSVDNACRGPEPRGLSWITAMFLHGGWDHIRRTAAAGRYRLARWGDEFQGAQERVVNGDRPVARGPHRHPGLGTVPGPGVAEPGGRQQHLQRVGLRAGNKFYVLDLAPGRSMAEYLVRNGQQVFVISWRNPDARHAGWGLDTYVMAVLDAHDGSSGSAAPAARR